jgi:hypothetical protein
MSSLDPPVRPTPDRPGAEDVRRAAEALKDAIDRHLFAVETRLGDLDFGLEQAYGDLADVGERYNALMLDAYDEVTPFVVAGEPEGGYALEDEGDEAGAEADMDLFHAALAAQHRPVIVDVQLRRRYAMVNGSMLVGGGQEAFAAAPAELRDELNLPYPENEAQALFVLAQIAGVDQLDQAAPSMGLEPRSGYVWFVAGDVDLPLEPSDTFLEPEDDNVLFVIDED